MTGWQRIKPQWVTHVDGYQVYNDGRFRVAYEDERGKAVIAAERLVGAVELDPVAIEWEAADGSVQPVAEADRALILQRASDGLRFMGTEPVVAGS